MSIFKIGAPAALLALAACNGGVSGNNSTAAVGGDAEAVTEAGSQESAKLAAYTQAYNKLIGTFGLTETAKRYEDAEVSEKTGSSNVSITDGWISQGRDALNKAIESPGDLGKADAAAKALRDTLDPLLKRLDALKIYYDSKAYKEDALARGKAEDAPMRADFTRALDALHAFDAQITILQRARDEKMIAEFKAKGDLLSFNSKTALRQAEDLVNLFNKPEDLKDPAVIAKGNAQITVLEKTLSDLRAETEKAKASGGDADRTRSLIYHGQVADYLTSLVGKYRELREDGDADDRNSMIDYYNRAIDAANNLN